MGTVSRITEEPDRLLSNGTPAPEPEGEDGGRSPLVMLITAEVDGDSVVLQNLDSWRNAATTRPTVKNSASSVIPDSRKRRPPSPSSPSETDTETTDLEGGSPVLLMVAVKFELLALFLQD